MPVTRQESIRGVLLGTAVGDALGLPFENLSARRRQKLFGSPTAYRFIAGYGMGSDDTELTCHVARAIVHSKGDINLFDAELGHSFRIWFLCLPSGMGRATAIACLRLVVGFPPSRSGVSSAGNGAAMRSAIIGVMFADDMESLVSHVKVSTRITHTDPVAESGALLVALASAIGEPSEFFTRARKLVTLNPQWDEMLSLLQESISSGQSTGDFARAQGWERGVSGYVLHTVPVALHAAFTSDTVIAAIIAAVECGGDTDTTAAIAGAVAGARLGPETIPDEFLAKWIDFPITMKFLNSLAEALGRACEGKDPKPPSFAWWLVPFRNLIFFVIVIGHVLRRLGPPY